MWVKTLCLGETVKKLSSRAVAMLTNGVLALILIVVGCVCFFPAAANVSSQLEERVIRRGTSADGVSLMINVYWGTEEVDGILDVLEEYGAKATFFLGGSWADDNTACVSRIAAAGHEIGTHGYFHRDHTTLGYDGKAALFWQTCEGGTGERSFFYEADPERGEITFFPAIGKKGRTFPMEDGTVRLSFNLGGRHLFALFARP